MASTDPTEHIQSTVWGRLHGLSTDIGVRTASPAAAPNLTDSSFRGLYAATTRAAEPAKIALNRVSAIIGAPALNGRPATVQLTAPEIMANPVNIVQRAQAQGMRILKGVRAQLGV